MANKTIFQLPASGALVSTDEAEKQVTGGGASQKYTLAQLLTYIQNNASAFTQAAVSFSLAINAGGGNFVVTSAGVVHVNGGMIVLQPGDGSAIFAGGQTQLGSDGGVSLAGGNFSVDAGGNVVGTSASIGTVQLATNAIFPNSATFSNGAVVFDANGNLVSTQDIEITDTTKGVILKSPNGTRYRLKVDNAGNLGTEVVP